MRRLIPQCARILRRRRAPSVDRGLFARAAALLVPLVLSAASTSCLGRDDARPRERDVAPLRAQCAFRAGAQAADTLGRELPVGKVIPLDTIVYMMQENRSFDSYLSELPKAGVFDVDVPPSDAANPGTDGRPVVRFHEARYCTTDLPHDWDPVHEQYGGGRNDGF